MKKSNNGLCTLEEYKQFRTSIFDAAEEWINICGCDAELGLAVDRKNLTAELCEQSYAESREWFPMDTFVADGDVDTDAVLDFADEFCFVG